MKKRYCLILFLILISFKNSLAADTCRVGIYLKALYDFNSSAYSYDVDFWVWYLYKNNSLKPAKTVEVSNSKKSIFGQELLQKVYVKSDTINWSAINCKATINQNWDLAHYPFDKQKLEIVLEESEKDVRNLILSRENKTFEFSSDIDIKGWEIDSITAVDGIRTYNTSFGDPTLNGKHSQYSTVTYTIFLSRESFSLFFKMFSGCYISFLVAFLVFFIRPIHVDPRFGLSIGGLFAAVGNKYVVDANMPESIAFTLVDKVHDITFLFILLTLILSVISLRYYNNNLKLKSKRFDKKAAKIVFALYVLINVALILRSAW
jgi:hypothetical protein